LKPEESYISQTLEMEGCWITHTKMKDLATKLESSKETSDLIQIRKILEETNSSDGEELLYLPPSLMPHLLRNIGAIAASHNALAKPGLMMAVQNNKADAGQNEEASGDMIMKEGTSEITKRPGGSEIKTPDRLDPRWIKTPDKLNHREIETPNRQDPCEIKTPDSLDPRDIKTPDRLDSRGIKTPDRLDPREIKNSDSLDPCDMVKVKKKAVEAGLPIESKPSSSGLGGIRKPGDGIKVKGGVTIPVAQKKFTVGSVGNMPFAKKIFMSKIAPSAPGKVAIPPTPAVASPEQSNLQTVQIVNSSDGKIEVRGLLHGQQLVQLPGGNLQIFSHSPGAITDAKLTTPGKIIEEAVQEGLPQLLRAKALTKEKSVENPNTDLTNSGGDGVSSIAPIENIFDGSEPGNWCNMACRSVRVGSYKGLPSEIIITEKGVQIKVPAIMNNMEIVTITIPMNDVLKVLAHFGKCMPILFLYISPGACKRVRESLAMSSSQSFFLDITSQDETQKRVTILPKKLTDENKMILKRFFKKTLQEMEYKEANEILVRSAPKADAVQKFKDELIQSRTVEMNKEVEVKTKTFNKLEEQRVVLDKKITELEMSRNVNTIEYEDRKGKAQQEIKIIDQDIEKAKSDIETTWMELKKCQDDLDNKEKLREDAYTSQLVDKKITDSRNNKIEQKIGGLKRKKIQIEKEQGDLPKKQKVNEGLVEYISNTIEDKKKDLDCPVCFETAETPIYQCTGGHLICKKCLPSLKICPECRAEYPKTPFRNRMAEKMVVEVQKLSMERKALLDGI